MDIGGFMFYRRGEIDIKVCIIQNDRSPLSNDQNRLNSKLLSYYWFLFDIFHATLKKRVACVCYFVTFGHMEGWKNEFEKKDTLGWEYFIN